MDLDLRYTKHLRAQAKSNATATATAALLSLACPFCKNPEFFSKPDHLFRHVFRNHHDEVQQAFGANVREEDRRRLIQERSADVANIFKQRQEPFRAISAEQILQESGTPQLADLSLEPKAEGEPKHAITQRQGVKREAVEEASGISTPRGSSPRRARRGTHDHPNRTSEDPDYNRDLLYPTPDAPNPKLESRTNHQKLKTLKSRNPRHGSGRQHILPTKHGSRAPVVSSPIGASSPSFESSKTSPQRTPGILQVNTRDPNMLLQPDSRPISQEQLAAEVKSIYSALIMVENKCMHVDRTQAAAIQKAQSEGHMRLPNEHWQALTALHRTLLHEHHDFFLASQHPSASEQLRRLAAKYSMPARMWKHGIHSFLELLRHQLPESLEYMLSFIYLAYQMMALLYETVPSFEDTWIECLGDLARYRMAIEDEDPRDRETWAGVARFWYSKAANKSPITGRLYHHLAILARPNALQQICLYARSLNCVVPFYSARDSVMTLLDPVLGRSTPAYPQLPTVDVYFVRLHSVLIERKPMKHEYWENSFSEYCEALIAHIDRIGPKWRDRGAYTAITNVAAIFEFGSDKSGLRCVFECNIKLTSIQKYGESTSNETGMVGKPPSPSLQEYETKLKELCSTTQSDDSQLIVTWANQLTLFVFSTCLKRPENDGVYPYVYIILCFLISLTRLSRQYEDAINIYVASLLSTVPWEDICVFMNTLIRKSEHMDLISLSTVTFLQLRMEGEEILPEDNLIRGQIWTSHIFPDNWFEGFPADDERVIQPPVTVKLRVRRMIQAGLDLASHNKWITFNREASRFDVIGKAPLSTTPMDTDPVTPPQETQILHRSGSGSIVSPAIHLESAATEDDDSALLTPGTSSSSSEAQTRRSPSRRSPVAQKHDSILPPADTDLLIPQRLHRSLSTDSMVITGGVIKMGTEVFMMDYTIIVWDVRPLIAEQDLFLELVTTAKYQVVVPQSAITQLSKLAKTAGPLKSQANQALYNVQQAVSLSSSVRVIDANGHDVTNVTFTENDSHRQKPADEAELKEMTLGIARQQSDLDRQMKELDISGDANKAKPAVLVTADTDEEIKNSAHQKGVSTTSTTAIRGLVKAALLKSLRKIRSRSGSRSSVGDHAV